MQPNYTHHHHHQQQSPSPSSMPLLPPPPPPPPPPPLMVSSSSCQPLPPPPSPPPPLPPPNTRGAPPPPPPSSYHDGIGMSEGMVSPPPPPMATLSLPLLPTPPDIPQEPLPQPPHGPIPPNPVGVAVPSSMVRGYRDPSAGNGNYVHQQHTSAGSIDRCPSSSAPSPRAEAGPGPGWPELPPSTNPPPPPPPLPTGAVELPLKQSLPPSQQEIKGPGGGMVASSPPSGGVSKIGAMLRSSLMARLEGTGVRGSEGGGGGGGSRERGGTEDIVNNGGTSSHLSGPRCV